MNTHINFEEIKQKGYYKCSISELFPEYINVLKSCMERTKSVDFRNMSHTGWENEEQQASQNVPFEELEKKKKGLILPNKSAFTQVWYNDNSFFTNYQNENNLIKELIFKIAETIYPIDIYKKTIEHIGLTMYNKGCFIAKHNDGSKTTKLCNILIYLNDDYETGKGGELIVNTDIIYPTFGTIVFLDFKHVNPEHSVSIITDDNFKRYALIASLIKSES